VSRALCYCAQNIFIGLTVCPYVKFLNSTTVTCLLSPSQGLLALVTARYCLSNGASRCLQITDPDILSDPAYPYLNFSYPRVTNILHSECTRVVDTDGLILKDCPRQGGGWLTITGTNFGLTGAVVVIGVNFCSRVFHAKPSSQLICWLPPGVSPDAAVYVTQAGGGISDGGIRLGFRQCQPGTHQHGLCR
jgi:hypothetical protein